METGMEIADIMTGVAAIVGTGVVAAVILAGVALRYAKKIVRW